MNIKDNSKNTKKRKNKSPFIRILTLVVLLCVAVFGTIIISDMFSKNNSKEDESIEPEFITIKISGDFIYLDSEKTDLEALRQYLDSEYTKGDLPVVTLINDTDTPSDYTMYNQVADLLKNYGITVDKMMPSTFDEITHISTTDEA